MTEQQTNGKEERERGAVRREGGGAVRDRQSWG